jgi:glycosyltransferase involved in cell wall biosynthesis
MQLSIIIPLKRPEPLLDKVLSHLPNNAEIILVGNIEIQSTSKRQKKAVTLPVNSKLRSVLMNKGAAKAKGKILLFLHPDTIVQKQTVHKIANLPDAYIGGGVLLEFIPTNWILTLIAKYSNFRMKTYKWIYGDQCMFIRKEIFKKLRGFKELELCEDLEFSLRFRKHGKLTFLPLCLTSARRFAKQGIIKQILINQLITLLFFLGVNDRTLRRIYGD